MKHYRNQNEYGLGIIQKLFWILTIAILAGVYLTATGTAGALGLVL